MIAPEHVVQFYETDVFLLNAMSDYIGTALRAGDVAIVFAPEARLEALDARLRADGLDVTTARARRQYVTVDAATALSRFMVDGLPEPGRFAEVVRDTIASAADGGRPVRIFGEMVALLVAEGNHAATIRLEELWNDLQRTYPFTLSCAYPMDRLSGEPYADLFGDICAEHSRVIPTESFTALADADDQLRTIARLQQQARWLEAEIAERKEAEERLKRALAAEQAAREAAEAALRLRDEFISVAAHELRTPLTSLVGHAQLVLRQSRRNGHLPLERTGRALQVITDQALRLSRLIDQLLDTSRLNRGALVLERRPTDLSALVERVVSEVRAVQDRHTITYQCPASVEAVVDQSRLEQVVTSLLDHAIRYSPDGGPVTVVLSRPVPGMVELSVRDHGVGVPPEERGHLFERFHQPYANGPQRGLGLGLYLSREIVELHGGEICAEFPAEGGTRIVVRLPVEASGPAGASPNR